MNIQNINVDHNLNDMGPAVEFEIDGEYFAEWLVRHGEFWICERRDSNVRMNYNGPHSVNDIHNFLDAALEVLV